MESSHWQDRYEDMRSNAADPLAPSVHGRSKPRVPQSPALNPLEKATALRPGVKFRLVILASVALIGYRSVIVPF